MTVTFKVDIPAREIKAGDKGQVITSTGKDRIVKVIRPNGLIEHIQVSKDSLTLEIWEPQRRTA